MAWQVAAAASPHSAGFPVKCRLFTLEPRASGPLARHSPRSYMRQTLQYQRAVLRWDFTEASSQVLSPRAPRPLSIMTTPSRPPRHPSLGRSSLLVSLGAIANTRFEFHRFQWL